MRSRIPGIMAAAQSALWAIQEDKLDAVLEFLERRASGVGLTKAQLIALGIRPKASAQVGRAAFRTVGQIAVLPLKGVIAHHAGMEMQISGGTSTVAFARAFDEAMNTPDVAAIVFDCDTPGGTVEGVPELAARIYEARGKGKQLIASVNAHCHSGGYWLASQCDDIYITPSGEAGDIGVMTQRVDFSEAEAKAGIKRTLIKAGKYKGEGNPAFAPDKAEIAAQKKRVQGMYDLFAADVARGRGVSIEDVENGMGEGRSLGAKECVATGLVDRIETLEQTLARLSGRPASRRSAMSAMSARSTQMERIAAIVAESEVQDVEECPECGSPLHMQDGTLECPECDYTAPDDERSAEDVSATAVAAGAVSLPLVASAGRTVIRAGAASDRVEARLVPIEEPQTTNTHKEPSVADEPKTPTLAELTAQATAAATERVNNITALCTAHDITAQAAAEFISSDKTVAQVGLAIAEQHRAARASSANNAASIRVGQDRENDRPFDNLGEQLQAIARYNDRNLGEPDKRLLAAVTTGGASANVGQDGAFAIQKEFTTELLESTIEGGTLLSQCDTHEVGANADGLEVMYLDETSRATGSRWGGVQVYRGAEADTATAKKPKFGLWESRLEDIIGLAYMTERLLRDASSIQNVFSTAFMAEYQFTAENELCRGTGAGQMHGVFGHAATVSVAKETGQEADTLNAANIGKMWKCVHPRSRLKGAWFYNIELEDQLDQLQIGTGTSAQLVYMPPGGLSGKPYGTIKGRPTIPIEYASGAGDVGDFFFGDWSQYKVITKDGIQSADSIHVGFVKNERTFRWISRINGAPKNKAAITPFKATDTNLKLSPFVTLAAR